MTVPALAARYAALQLQLARQFPEDRLAYTEGQNDFVRTALDRAGLA